MSLRGTGIGRREHGISLVSAIFLLVVLAGLGAVAVRVNVMQQQASVLALRSAEALHAARSGVAWAAWRAMPDNGGFCGTDTLALSEAGAAGYRVTVSCSESVHPVGAGNVHVYVIDALAEAGTYGSPDYVSRRLQAKVSEET